MDEVNNTVFVDSDTLEREVRPLCEDDAEFDGFLEECHDLCADIIDDGEEFGEDECLYVFFHEEDGLEVVRTDDIADVDDVGADGCAVMLLAAHADDVEFYQLEMGRWYEGEEYFDVRNGDPRNLDEDEINDLVRSVAEEFDDEGYWPDEDYEEDVDEEPRRSRSSSRRNPRKLKPAEPALQGSEKLWDETWKSCYVTKKLDPKSQKAQYHVEGQRDDVFAWRKYVMQQYAPFKFGWRTLHFSTDPKGKLVLDIERALSTEEEALLKQTK